MCSKRNRISNLSIFNMTTGINELKTLAKHVSCDCKCKFDVRRSNSNQKWNNNKCRCKSKNSKTCRLYEKDYIWNPATWSCKNGKYLASIIDDSVITCDEIIKKQKQFQKALMKKRPAKPKIYIFYLPFY